MRRLALASLLATLSLTAVAAPEAYTIDPTHTQVHFTWNHLGFSNITGRFDAVEGTFLFDPENPAASSVEVKIPVSSMDTGVDKLDQHLASADFFDAAQFPHATFRSTGVTADGANALKVAGDLTIHGVTRPVVLDVTINRIGEHPMAKVPAAGFDARTTIRRSDFGIGAYVPNVGDEIEIEITLEATRAK